MFCLARRIVVGARAGLCVLGFAVSLFVPLAAGVVRAESTGAVSGSAYPPVTPGRAFSFPRDFGAHPLYRTEWWYVTGWLRDDEDVGHGDVERGFQVTFFRVRSLIGEDNPSRFAPSQLVIAHAALADRAEGRLLHAERSARALPPLAGAESGTTRVWIGDWSLALTGEGYEARMKNEAFALDLRLTPDGPPLLNGEGGYSRKAPQPEHASYYYSRPQLAVSGTITLHGRQRRVQGTAWLDHEWSSALMPAGAAGWDWAGLNLHDGGALMAFRMRGENGEPMWSAATVREADGRMRVLPPQAVRWRPLRHWHSAASGAAYPVEWEIELDDGPDSAADQPVAPLRLEPLMDDQELDGRRSTGTVYWEGAVRVMRDGKEIGRGYLEMTGYANRPRL